ncbi:MAG: hypothetical protein JNL01_08515 [Bdellovibrionales bacterium]|nr:hypothetical protein [Bdellovibrionales bacterium]
MYGPILFIHSWVRWGVLLGALFLIVRTTWASLSRQNWTARDNYWVWAYGQIFGYQLIFGLTLYFGLSPMTRSAFQNFSEAMENPVLFFWSIRHPLTLILAFAVFVLGKRLCFNRLSLETRHRGMAAVLWVSTAILLSAIPWPVLEYGRPWVRGFTP